MVRGEVFRGVRGRRLLVAGVCAIAVAGCGSTQHFADRARPATPVDLTVYIDNSRVSVSPAHVGAGPVVFLVTNQASKTVSMNIEPLGGSIKPLATTGPINPGSTAQVQVDFATGAYQVSTDAQATPATLHIGKPRASSDNVLLQP